MNISLLRLIWSEFENTPSHLFKGGASEDHAALMIRRIERQTTLSQQERSLVQRYIVQHHPLIRDICMSQMM